MSKILFLSLTSISFLFLNACNEQPQVETRETIRAVKTLVVSPPDSTNVRHFPGRVDANRKATLAFRVSGKVQQLLIKEGDEVKQGQLLARLDPKDFQISLNDKQAQFSRAQKDYLRAKKLVAEGNISKMDFDSLESQFLSAKANLRQAKQQLAYTHLKAPFDGIIARRYIQNFEEVQAKQQIVALHDINILEIKFDIPEKLILDISKREGVSTVAESQAKHKIPVYASFSSANDTEYRLSFKEISTRADETSKTFTITYTMPKPKNFNLFPGMSTSVRAELGEFMQLEKSFYLPVSAVVADKDLNAQVWIVNEKSMQVEPIAVQVGKMSANQIEITAGLKSGQRVVTAGVPFLYRGLKVSLIKITEQAEDNLFQQRPQMMETNNHPAKEG